MNRIVLCKKLSFFSLVSIQVFLCVTKYHRYYLNIRTTQTDILYFDYLYISIQIMLLSSLLFCTSLSSNTLHHIVLYHLIYLYSLFRMPRFYVKVSSNTYLNYYPILNHIYQHHS